MDEGAPIRFQIKDKVENWRSEVFLMVEASF